MIKYQRIFSIKKSCSYSILSRTKFVNKETKKEEKVFNPKYEEKECLLQDDNRIQPLTSAKALMLKYQDFKLAKVENSKILKVCIIGLANSGKSTLINNLLKTNVFATCDKEQTTRKRLTGVITKDNKQLILMDTPGIVVKNKHLKKLDRELVTAPWFALDESDVCLLVVDGKEIIENEEYLSVVKTNLMDKIKKYEKETILVVNKMDLLGVDDSQASKTVEKLLEDYKPILKEIIIVSGLLKININQIEEKLLSKCKDGEFMYPKEYKNSLDKLEIIKETIREQLYSKLKSYIPYTIKQENVGFGERNNVLFIVQNLLVESKNIAVLGL